MVSQRIPGILLAAILAIGTISPAMAAKHTVTTSTTQEHNVTSGNLSWSEYGKAAGLGVGLATLRITAAVLIGYRLYNKVWIAPAADQADTRAHSLGIYTGITAGLGALDYFGAKAASEIIGGEHKAESVRDAASTWSWITGISLGILALAVTCRSSL